MAIRARPSDSDARPSGDRKVFAVDWGELSSLRLRARSIADGVYAGAHASVRKGAGIEFGGYRGYTPGDDLRFLDRRALLRHDRLVIRELETETDRALWLVVDASASMAFRGVGAKSAKLAYAALLAAVLARIALASGDPVGLAWIGGHDARPLPAMGGREAYDRLVGSLEGVSAGGDVHADALEVHRALAPVARRARRGAVVVLLSDLLDLPPRSIEAFSALGVGGRVVIAVQVLDPTEVELDFGGHVRLRALEGGAVVEADPDQVREQYKAGLRSITTAWESSLEARGGRLVSATSNSDASAVVRTVLRRIAEAGR